MSQLSFDPNISAAWRIRVEDEVSDHAGRKKLAGVRLNHQPELDAASLHVTLRCETTPHRSTLNLRDRYATYRYQGQYDTLDDDLYALLLPRDGREKELVLHKLDSNHVYNLVADEHHPNAHRYPRLSLAEEDEGDLFGESDDETEAPIDSDNPFDFRHYLSAVTESDDTEIHVSKRGSNDLTMTTVTKGRPPSQITSAPASVTSNSRNSTAANSDLKSATGKTASVFQTKRKSTQAAVKANAATKLDVKRAQAKRDDRSQSSVVSAHVATAPRPGTKTNIPKVKLDRKASLRPPPNDDLGELILENESPSTERPLARGSAMSLALTGQLGQGPISLHSAASSPAGRFMSASPASQRLDDHESSMELVLEGSISPDELAVRGSVRGRQPRGLAALADREHEATAKARSTVEAGDIAMGENDEEIELVGSIESGLKSPDLGQHHLASQNSQATNGGEYEDDLEEQFALAFANEDPDIPGTAPVAESEEESEEE